MFGKNDGGAEDSNWEAARERLVDRVSSRIDSEETLAAMHAVPRHEFVPDTQRENAYTDRPLPIGKGQTISAPHMVAIMTDLLALEPGENVLEVGTGCGYHAAVTAEIVGADHLFSVEYESALADASEQRLARLGYDEISIRVGDGHAGWPAHAPYDAAYLTCAARDFPQAVCDQVREGGRVLAPIGDRRQTLMLARKTANGLEREDHGGVRFVRMQGGA